jgi:hypothetical protein
MALPFARFIDVWSKSGASERANKDHFLNDLCDALGVPRPNPSAGDPDLDTYVYERDVMLSHEGASASVGHIDLYKEGCFILEAKQGSEKGSPKLGTARRGTPGWNIAMHDAFGQALIYAHGFDQPPPFIVVCDIGHCFDLYASFDRTMAFTPFPNALSSRLYLPEIEKHADVLRQVFLDPTSLDPARRSTKVTREVAAHLADLAKALEADGHGGEAIATFLMRCIFTMFAEDVGLLPERTFTESIEKFWLPNPAAFPVGVSELWRAMNAGGSILTGARLRRFNGGLFSAPDALPLKKSQLQLLVDAAKCDWADVEPAIFGTLLERALDADERHALGAHFTPKAYVERLVRPTIEEPLRADWTLVQAEVRHLVEADNITQARKVVRDFHQKLCSIKVLDPACGSGNFLYVTLDLFKRLETEVLALLGNLGEAQTVLEMQTVSVNPSQFLGIEVKRWAKEIAELVLWIGYLQWHFRSYRRGEKAAQVSEPVLQDFKNIECRDAVLAWDGDPELVRDESGKPVTRWDGKSTKKHPVTGEDVPDETKTIPVYRYVNPRKAEWPKVDFIVGNPPFIGNARMRSALGDGYTEALRATYAEVPESVDYVMYWWDKAAEIVREGKARRFGFITTNSLTQAFARRVLQRHLDARPPVSLVFAVPDHPWVDSAGGAAVRIAMSVVECSDRTGCLATIVEGMETPEGPSEVRLRCEIGKIHADLKIGANIVSAASLRSNEAISSRGVALHGAGFIVTPAEAALLGVGRADGMERLVREYRNGKDLTNRPRGVRVIDLLGLSETRLRDQWPTLYQRVFERVKPERDQNNRASYRENWWIFGEPRKEFRPALEGLPRYIATVETSRHRFFVFLDGGILPDNKLVNIAVADSFFLGVLSSRVHVRWAVSSGGRLGVGNDPVYVKTTCFEKFPFPVCSAEQTQRIRELGEALDAHRKRQQAEHADLTITGMYNVLEKLRSGEALTAKERVIHEQGLVSVLKKIHDDLDVAVFDAYGWPHDLADEQILERLVALNAERVAEEKRGLVRWLRPEFQCKDVKLAQPETVPLELSDDEEAEHGTKPKARGRKAKQATPGAPAEVLPAKAGGKDKARWPETLPDQIAAVRDLVLGTTAGWTAETVARSFKFARATSVEPVLESLAALGLLVRYQVGEVKAYRKAGRA